jgi:hypothetical protein
VIDSPLFRRKFRCQIDRQVFTYLRTRLISLHIGSNISAIRRISAVILPQILTIIADLALTHGWMPEILEFLGSP